jgi:threonine dehydratase
MPRHAPIMKVNNCKSFGAVVIIRGMDLGEVNNLMDK